MNKFTIDDRQMSYLDQGQGPVIVFGHSYLWDSEMWAPQVEQLSQYYRCIVPELWAHGESDYAPESTHSLKDYAVHVLALLDHLKVEEFSIVGLSVGGMWGAEVVTLAPQRVKALVLMDTFLGLEPEVTHKKYFTMLDAISNAQMVPEPILETVVPLFFSKDAKQNSPELVAQFHQKLSSVNGKDAVEIARIGRMVFGRRDLMDEVEKFALPVLIAVGLEDIPRSPLESYLMHDSITGSELVHIGSAGHISNLEQPETVSTMLSDFFAKVLG